MRNTVDCVTYVMLVRIFRINLEHIIISAQNGMIVGCSRHLQVVGLVDSTAYCSLIHINHLPEIEMKICQKYWKISERDTLCHTHTNICARARQQTHIYTLIAHTRNTMCGLWLQLFNEKICLLGKIKQRICIFASDAIVVAMHNATQTGFVCGWWIKTEIIFHIHRFECVTQNVSATESISILIVDSLPCQLTEIKIQYSLIKFRTF